MKDLNKTDLPIVKPSQQTNGKVSDLDGKPPEETDYANYFCESPCAAVGLASFQDQLPFHVCTLCHHSRRMPTSAHQPSTAWPLVLHNSLCCLWPLGLPVMPCSPCGADLCPHHHAGTYSFLYHQVRRYLPGVKLTTSCRSPSAVVQPL